MAARPILGGEKVVPFTIVKGWTRSGWGSFQSSRIFSLSSRRRPGSCGFNCDDGIPRETTHKKRFKFFMGPDTAV